MNKVFLAGILFLSIMAVVLSFGCIEKDDSLTMTQWSSKGDVVALTAKLQVLQNAIMDIGNRLSAIQTRLDGMQNQQRNLTDLVQSMRAETKNPSLNKQIQIVVATDGSTGPARTFDSVDEAVQFLNQCR